ncbi:hypothetical protein [Streptomyces sp. UG1]|uniref:hypothetical protein n=1 Tax=Streptomyces sp. UG1 TaxID=3417652 RepID=UPI003CFA1D32
MPVVPLAAVVVPALGVLVVGKLLIESLDQHDQFRVVLGRRRSISARTRRSSMEELMVLTSLS